jgi:hypothetical protein
MSKYNVKYACDMVPYILRGEIRFNFRKPNNESALYAHIKNMAIHPAMFAISFDQKKELECISDETGMTCLMLALDLYDHPTIKKDPVYRTQLLSIVQQIFFNYEKDLLHRDKKGNTLLYYFIKKVQDKKDKFMVGHLIQHLLFEYLSKGIEIDWDVVDENNCSIRYLFLRNNWNEYVHLTPQLEESFYRIDMKKPCNFKLVDEMRDNQKILEICIQSIREDPEIERYEFLDGDNHSLLQCMVMMMNKEDEDFVMNLIDDPKFFYFKYDIDHPRRHIILNAISNSYFRFSLKYLQKMKESYEWNEFISILLDPEVGFYEHMSNHIEEIQLDTSKEAYPFMELFEFVFQHDKHKRTIEKMDSQSLISISMLEDNDIRYVHYDLFNRIMNIEDTRHNNIYILDENMIRIIGFMKNSLKVNPEYTEDDLATAFSRLIPHLNLRNFYDFFKSIEEHESLMRIVFDIRRVRRHVCSFLSQMKKENLICETRKDDCPICITPLENKYYACCTCKQGSHLSCLAVWLKDHSTCVMCRSNITSEDRKRIGKIDKMIFYRSIADKYMVKKE